MQKLCPKCESNKVSLNPLKVNIENPHKDHKYDSGASEKMNKCSECGHTFD